MSSLEHSWSRERAATLKDVAKLAGVSEPTASVVLNEARSGTRVSAKTRLVVIEAARELGYRPNAQARSLQKGRTNRIGVFSGAQHLDARNMFFAEILGGAFEGCSAFGLNTLIHTSGSSSANLLELVSNRAIDGLLLHAGQESHILTILHELRVPAIAVADKIDGLPSVCVDDVAGGMLQAHHLHNLGHQDVIYKQAHRPLPSALIRAESFTSNAESLGMRVEMTHANELGEPPVITAADLAKITRAVNPVTAVVGWSDYLAENICQELDDLEIDVPGRVAVLGFDGMLTPFRRRFELSTIRAPWNDVGRTAVNLLVSLSGGEPVPDVTILPVQFVRGKTS